MFPPAPDDLEEVDIAASAPPENLLDLDSALSRLEQEVGQMAQNVPFWALMLRQAD